jgi:hypothetical protein
VEDAIEPAGQTEKKLVNHAERILDAAQDFMADAEALVEIFEIVIPPLRSKQKEYRKELEELFESFKANDSGALTMNLSGFVQLNRLRAKHSRGHFLFRGHILVALISRFDAFIAAVCRELLRAFPSRLGSKTLSFAEATQFKNLEELENKIVSDVIDEQMRGSHLDQIAFLSSLANVTLGDDEPELFGKFIELTERRNCHVHFSGRASTQYLRVCSEHKAPVPTDVKEGMLLNVHLKYLINARYVLVEMAFKISQTIVRKVFGEFKTTANAYLTQIGLQLLEDNREAEALQIFDYAVNLKGNWGGDDGSKRTSIINKALTLKKMQKKDVALRVINSMDWSAAHPKFLMAIHILRDEFQQATLFMPASGVAEEQYREWPLFDGFRESDEFKNAYFALFNKDFDRTLMDAAAVAMAEIDNGDLPLGEGGQPAIDEKRISEEGNEESEPDGKNSEESGAS